MFIFIIFPIIWLILGVVIISWLGKKIHIQGRIKKLTVLSFLFALFFGIGAVGVSNADPGFAMPAPVFLSALDYLSDSTRIGFILNGTIDPLLFWWVISFAWMFLFGLVKRRMKKS